jgi:hypothetical protein
MGALGAIVKDELAQLIATGVIVLLFVGFQAAIDTVYLPSLGQAAGAATPAGWRLQDAGISTVRSLQGRVGENINSLGDLNRDAGKIASQSVYCNYMGSGFTLVACNSINSVRGGLANAMNVLAAAALDLTGLELVLQLANAYAFSFLLPIGIFLRTFKFTRAAGGALISVALGFYIILPLMVLFSENHLMNGVMAADLPNAYLLQNPDYGSIGGSLRCDPYEMDAGQVIDFAHAVNTPSLYSPILFLAIVRVIFMTIVEMMVTLTFIAWFAKIVGSEIDVSSLARIS